MTVNIENVLIRVENVDPVLDEPFVAESYEDIVGVFEAAIPGEAAVRFVYTRVEDGISEIRTLTPGEIVDARDGERAVLGHDHDRDGARQFRLDRVEFAMIDEAVAPYRV